MIYDSGSSEVDEDKMVEILERYLRSEIGRIWCMLVQEFKVEVGFWLPIRYNKLNVTNVVGKIGL